jgi:hypothetical protein
MRYYLFDMLVHNGVNMMTQNLEKRYGVSLLPTACHQCSLHEYEGLTRRYSLLLADSRK